MLMPDNIHPEECLYYTGSLVLRELHKNPKQKMVELYLNVREGTVMSFSKFVLSLDWLFLAEMISMNEKGEVELCTLNG